MGGASKLLMLVSAPLQLLYPRASAFRLARYSSVSVAWLSSVAHRRRFFSNPRPFPCFSIKASEQIHTQTSNVREDYYGESSEFLSSHRVSHPWPEWSKLLENLKAGGFFDHQGSPSVALEGELSMDENLPEDFLSGASACLSFARSRSDFLRSLSMKDIEVVIENGTPFLFKNALDSARRMKSFLRDRGNNGLEIERADMVDLMRYLLSYACNAFVASDRVNISNKEMVESSVRILLSELADATITDQGLCLSGSVSNHYTDSYGQTPKPVGPNIEMKRGDWICQKCSFMNFARNIKCLECNESRPKRQLAGGEWECPQCDFFNYGRNSTCLRCDCKRPGGPTYGAMTPGSDLGYSSENNLNKADIGSRLGENDEKAERWFSKFSRLDKASDVDSAAADKDFPEIMPVNRFVVSTRKTPLERRLADAQYRRNLGNDGTPDEDDLQARNEGEVNQSMTLQTSISQSLDRILGCSSAHSESVVNRSVVGEMAGTEKSSFSSSASQHYGRSEAQKLETVSERVAGNHDSFVSSTSNTIGSLSGSVESGKSKDGLQLSGIPLNQAESKEDREQAEKSERWFKKVAELHDVKDLSSAISDEDFPEIMPMRKGENRFVVSKKKDRSMTSPLYKRRMAMEQSSNTNFVPFVPFPPDYFAKKDKQPGIESSTEKAVNENASVGTAESAPNVLGKSSVAGVVTNWGASSISVPRLDNQHTSGESWDATRAVNGCGDNNSDAVYRVPTMAMSGERPENLQKRNGEVWNAGSSHMGSAESAGCGASTVGSPIPRTEWNGGSSQRGSAESAGYCASTTPRTDWNSRSSQQGSAESAGYGTSTVGSFTPRTDWNNGSSQRGSAESAGYGASTVGGFIPRTDWNSGSSQRGSAESAGYGASAVGGITPRTDWNSGSSQRVSAESAGYGASGVGGFTSRIDNLRMNSGEVWNSGSSWKGSMGLPTMGSSTLGSDNLQINSQESWNTGSSWKGSTGGAIGSSSQQPQNLKNGPESWNRGFSGGSLEGSAVKEPDPLDMSQEAKEQRWFRRVAQIKDISELSNIPDEDFPEIMPMRKGVNRFVVSKRKTPLERRLTSPQYRRNLPIVNSDPLKKENDSS